MKTKRENGFTLLELIIVIGIIAILSVALVIVLNPAETLKKARDAQRISDLSTLKTAIGLYLTNTTTPYLGGTSNNNLCKATPSDTWGGTPTTSRLAYSIASASIADTSLDAGSVGVRSGVTTPSLIDGSGWIPVNFSSLTGGSPISNLPIDPVNSVGSTSAVANTDLLYRYGCSVTPLAYEIDATLESTAYNSMMSTDGGNNANYFETGTNLQILGTGTDF